MTNYSTHWCPKGCGKKIIYVSIPAGFVCKHCGVKYKTLKDIEKAWGSTNPDDIQKQNGDDKSEN